MQRKQVQIEEIPSLSETLCEHLSETGYSKYTIRRVRVCLDQYYKFSISAGTKIHNSFSVQNFIIANQGDDYQDKYYSYSISRPFAMLEDYLQFGTVMRQKYRAGGEYEGELASCFRMFLEYMRQQGYAEASVKSCHSHLLRFQYFLRGNGIHELCDLTHEAVKLYPETLLAHSTTNVCQITRDLKRFFGYAQIHGFLRDDFSKDLPHFKNTRGQRLPDRFTADEINKIIGAIDRDNPLGRRDYAIVLTAVRLGLRNGDVIALKFCSVDWAKKEVRIVQKKTGIPPTLPLPDDVGWAIIDYIRNSRPDSTSENIFVSFTPPYQELTQYSNYVAKYMRKAGLYSGEHRRAGMHTLRRSLATAMLENNIPVTVIAQTLGHGDLHTVGNYIRVSTKLLKQCAMEVSDYE